MQRQESVPSVLEADARGEVADVYADIRSVLGTSVVNLIWRNLATMPGALEWTWSTVRPLYLGDAPLHAEAVRGTIALPEWPVFSADTLLAAGVDEAEQALIRDVLGHPHNALAWLANHLVDEGKGLHAGQIVLTGSLVKTVWLDAGDSVKMELDGLGTVQAKFL